MLSGVMVFNNATHFSLLIGQVGWNAFNFLWYKVVPRAFFPPTPSLRRDLKEGKATHAVINVPPFRWAFTLISDRLFWCAEWQNKTNTERKAVKDLQRGALINKGFHQLGPHDWCVNVSAVTQFGILRRVTPLFTEHKAHKQAHCQVWIDGHSKGIYGLYKYFSIVPQIWELTACFQFIFYEYVSH